MGTTPEELRHEIEDTRRHLSETVERIADKVSPGRMAHRRAQDTKRRLGGTAHRVRGAVHVPHHGADGSAGPATAEVAVRHPRRRAPMAAGVLAVCTGAAAGAAVLRSRRQQQKHTGFGAVRHWRH